MGGVCSLCGSQYAVCPAAFAERLRGSVDEVDGHSAEHWPSQTASWHLECLFAKSYKVERVRSSMRLSRWACPELRGHLRR